MMNQVRFRPHTYVDALGNFIDKTIGRRRRRRKKKEERRKVRWQTKDPRTVKYEGLS
jgi:hypothetical protein